MDFELMQEEHPNVAVPHTLYCPNGHNAYETTKGFDECAMCGALMLPDHEEQFNDSLVSAGALQ